MRAMAPAQLVRQILAQSPHGLTASPHCLVPSGKLREAPRQNVARVQHHPGSPGNVYLSRRYRALARELLEGCGIPGPNAPRAPRHLRSPTRGSMDLMTRLRWCRSSWRRSPTKLLFRTRRSNGTSLPNPLAWLRQKSLVRQPGGTTTQLPRCRFVHNMLRRKECQTTMCPLNLHLPLRRDKGRYQGQP